MTSTRRAFCTINTINTAGVGAAAQMPTPAAPHRVRGTAVAGDNRYLARVYGIRDRSVSVWRRGFTTIGLLNGHEYHP